MKVGETIVVLIDSIKSYFQHKKEIRRARYYAHLSNEIDFEFRLEEKNGTFYILHNGTAIETFPKHVSLECVQGRMKQLRSVAKFYAMPDEKRPI